MTRFVLMLHSHLPWVLHHGRWPHGSDWLTEAAIDTYLPLLEALHELDEAQTPAPVTLGITPVLANQLAHPDFVTELEQYFAQRLEACDAAPASLARTGESHLLPVVRFWRQTYQRLQRTFAQADRDLVGAFRRFAEAGRLELVSSGATHGFLPLLGTDESIRLQLRLGQAEHQRLFGRPASGCWMPECAYRPAGPWAPLPDAPGAGNVRAGIERFVAGAGFRYAFVDSHLVAGGTPLGYSGGTRAVNDPPRGTDGRSPYRIHKVRDDETGRELAVFARDPRLSAQVWSRFEGYPGDPRYLEFHKMRWPGGLKLWRVTGPGADLGAKAAYDPLLAQAAVRTHGEHFAEVATSLALQHQAADAVLCAPFDTELFGHWWFEGPDFLRAIYGSLRARGVPRPSTASDALAAAHPQRIALPPGSWGANGDWSMWLSDLTAWTWRRLWPLERRFWTLAPQHLGDTAAHPALAQAARALLLAQSSDWQFIISTGAAADYAERRFVEHCLDLERLLDALGTSDRGAALAAELHTVDDCFPTVLDSVADVVRGAA